VTPDIDADILTLGRVQARFAKGVRKPWTGGLTDAELIAVLRLATAAVALIQAHGLESPEIKAG
jgi:hypothetical protein